MRASQAVRAFYDAWPRADQRSHLLHGLKHGRGRQEVEEEYLLTYYLLEEAEADSTTSSMSRSRTSMRSTSMSRSSAPVDVSAEALLVGPVTILAHANLLGQAVAREEPARGAAEHRAMHGRRQRRAAMQYIVAGVKTLEHGPEEFAAGANV